MKFNMMIFLFILTHCFKGCEMFSRKSSPLLESYGCLERTNITLFTVDSWGIYLYDLLTDLEDPCFSIFYYSHKSRNIVQWNGDRNQVEYEMTMSKKLSESETMEFIESLYEQQVEKNDTTKQILLVYYSTQMKVKVLKAIELLDRETDWNVIINCMVSSCPILQHLPINRIVATNPFTGNYQKSFQDIVKNLDFNKNEFIKHIKLDNAKLTCLANKTIHVFMTYPSVELLENIVQIVYNTQELSTKIILYVDKFLWYPNKFWTYYIEKNGWKNIVNIVFRTSSKPLPHQNTDEVYLISEFGMYLFGELYFCSLTRKSVVFYEFKIPESFNKMIDSKEWYNDIYPACKKNIKMVSFNKNYDSEGGFAKNFIEEVFSASCF